MYYVFDIWIGRWHWREARSEMILVRYADDQIVGFEWEDDASLLQLAMQARLEEFALKLHPDKTRLIEFRRNTVARRLSRGLDTPETEVAPFVWTAFCCSLSGVLPGSGRRSLR
ncbi:MAG: hypothetical protein ACRYGP_10730 [Janthinobacterium lividum]